MGVGHGYGKVILFGEHFVLHGYPAIVSALANKTIAIVERRKGNEYELIDKRPATRGYKEQKAEEQAVSLQNIFRAMKVDPKNTPLRITLEGDLVAASGVGASAASCAAIARAINDEFGLNHTDEKINEIAYEGEKGFHGTPSGIDNTAAVYGGTLVFKRDVKGGPPFFEKLDVRNAFEIVEGDTGITASTAKVVSDVQRIRGERVEEFQALLEEYENVVKHAKKAFNTGDLVAIGKLMNRNMELLRGLHVSCNELELLIKIALENGAYGAKLTGTGRGGLMYALTPGRELQRRIAEAFEKEGFVAYTTTIR